MADQHKNFAYSTVATAPSPATTGTSLVVAAADGAKFPTVPFNATVWPAGAQPLTTNAEIVRVTTISTDTFTITRAQESSTARSVVVGDQIAATVTAKTLTDAEGLTRVGGNTTEATTTSTTAVDLLTATGLSIATNIPIFGLVSVRRTTGAASSNGFGVKLNTTVIGEAGSSVSLVRTTATDQAEAHSANFWLGPRIANYNLQGSGVAAASSVR